MNPVFKTLREAGIAGARLATQLAKRDRWEYGGYVLSVPNGFTYSDIVTSRKAHMVNTSAAVPADLRARREAISARAAALRKEGVITPATEVTDPNPALQALIEDMERLEDESKARLAGIFHAHITEGMDEEGEDQAQEAGRYFSGQDINNVVKGEWVAFLGLTHSGQVFELDGRTQESFKASTGVRKFAWDFYPSQKTTAILQAIVGGPPPILASGIEVFTGEATEQQEAA